MRRGVADRAATSCLDAVHVVWVGNSVSLLGIDVGTTGCKAAVFSADGTCLAQAYREYGVRHPHPGWAELDSNEVWNKIREVIASTAAATTKDKITALSVSSLGEAMVPVTTDRRILGNSILCIDVRGSEYVTRLDAAMGREMFYKINPNILGPQYSLPKLLWMRDNEPNLFNRADFFLLWADLVAFMLGCGPVTADSLANRTLLFDLRRNDWSDELLAWSGLQRRQFGRVARAGTVVGKVCPKIAAELNLPRDVCVVVGGHDQCCNALGCGCIEAGKATCGIGTFECITPCYAEIPDPVLMLKEGLNIEDHVVPGLYVSFLFNQAGVLVKWFRDTFAAEYSGQSDVYEALNRELPMEPTRLLVLPHFVPPVWPEPVMDSAGVILGLRTETTRGEILKAIMEGTTFYFVDSMDSLRRMGIGTREFVATGGGARSDAWLQIKADIFGVPFLRPSITESTVLGAAMLAGIGTGVYRSAREAVSCFVSIDRVFVPDASRHAVYRERMELYRRLFPSIRDIVRQLVCAGGP